MTDAELWKAMADGFKMLQADSKDKPTLPGDEWKGQE